MNEADKVTAELMALADALAVEAHGDGRAEYEGYSRATNNARSALEQAIRRAVDLGEPVAYTTKAQIAAMQNGYQRNLTAVDAKFAEAFGAKDNSDKVPLYARNKP